MLEKTIERKLVMAVRGRGGLCLKLSCPGFDGMPDRLILLPGRAAFVELKAPGKKPRPLQLKRMKQLKALGFPCFTLDGTSQIAQTLDEIQTGGDAL